VTVTSTGTVQEWNDDDGIGVLVSADTPGGCWVHFSCIVAEGRRSLTRGHQVSFTYEVTPQDGYSYRAVLVWPAGVQPGTQPSSRHHHGPSAAYQSRLTIRWADGTVTEGIAERKQRG
jgi:CspA family cold shock protein